MATSAQSRLDRLLKNTPKPQVEDTTDAEIFWKKELNNAQQRRQPKTPDEIKNAAIDDPSVDRSNDDQANSPTALTTSSIDQDNLVRSVEPSESHMPSASPAQVVYLPTGKGEWNSHAIGTVDDDDWVDSEPGSSSSELIGRFCIFSQTVKFPYRYMSDPESAVSRRFFAAEKAYERNWSMHYLVDPESYPSKPLMLVPLQQVQTLIQEIAQEFKIKVDVPGYPFQLAYYNDGTPAPVLIGVVNSKSDMTRLQAEIPITSNDNDRLSKILAKAKPKDQATWRGKIERAFEAERKKKGKSKKGIQKRVATISANLDSLVRAQRFLGLKSQPTEVEALASSLSSKQIGPTGSPSTTIRDCALDVEKAAPFSFIDDVVMISIDVESWESDHSVITEIGLSTLDTADIKNLPIGIAGSGWTKEIRSRHFRIQGRDHLTNYKFVQGCPDMFRFGTSEFVGLKEAPEAVDSCFEYPFSAAFRCEGTEESSGKNVAPPADSYISAQPVDAEDKARSLLLIGHDVATDIDYLSSLGSSIFDSSKNTSTNEPPGRRQRVLSSIREYTDTAALYKTLCKDEQPRSLMKICSDLGIIPWHAHNAGNDARYTLEAFVKMVIKSRQLDDDALGNAEKPVVDEDEEDFAY